MATAMSCEYNKVLLDINSTCHFHVPFLDFHGLTESLPVLEYKSQKEGAKRSVTFSESKLLTVGTCRSVFISTAGVILTFGQAAFFFGKKRNTRKRTPDRRLAALSMSCDVVVIAQTGIPFSTSKSSFWEIRNFTEWIGGKVPPS